MGSFFTMPRNYFCKWGRTCIWEGKAANVPKSMLTMQPDFDIRSLTDSVPLTTQYADLSLSCPLALP